MTRLMLALAAVAAIAISIQSTTVADAEKTKLSADEIAVRALVEKHFAAIKSGDAKTINQIWDTANGRLNYLIKQGGEVQVRSQPVARAVKRWTSKPDGKSAGAIKGVEVVGGRMALVRIRFTWRGATYQEHLTAFKAHKGWTLVNKTFISSAGIPAVSPYAPGDW